VIGVTKDPILGIIPRRILREGVSQEQILVFFGEMGFGGSSTFFLMITMTPFLKPVGD